MIRVLAITSGLLLAVLLGPTPSEAHVVYDRRTLRQWAQEADVIVLAQFRTGMQVWRAPDGSDAQEYFTVRVVEPVRGQATTDIDFFAHAEGEPRWRPGDVAVLFLDRTAERAEFARLATRFPYFSVQGAGQEWTVGSPTRDEVISAVRHWAAVSAPVPAEVMRTALLRELHGADVRLQSDALAELVYATCKPSLFPDAAAVEPFANLVTAGALGVPMRVALARALDGCPGFDSGAALRRLTDQPLAARDRTALIRVAGMSDDHTLGNWLASLLDDPDPQVRREAAAALGHPRHHGHVAALARAAARRDAGAVAAVRALAGIGTADARAALTELTRTGSPEVANSARAYLAQPTPASRR